MHETLKLRQSLGVRALARRRRRGGGGAARVLPRVFAAARRGGDRDRRRRLGAVRGGHRRQALDLAGVAARHAQLPPEHLHVRHGILQLLAELLVALALLRGDLAEPLQRRGVETGARVQRGDARARALEVARHRVGVGIAVGARLSRVRGVHRVEDFGQKLFHRLRSRSERVHGSFGVLVQPADVPSGAVLVLGVRSGGGRSVRVRSRRVSASLFVFRHPFVIRLLPRALLRRDGFVSARGAHEPAQERVLHAHVGRGVEVGRVHAAGDPRGEGLDVRLQRVPLRRNDIGALLVRRLLTLQRRDRLLAERDLLAVHLELRRSGGPGIIGGRVSVSARATPIGGRSQLEGAGGGKKHFAGERARRDRKPT